MPPLAGCFLFLFFVFVAAKKLTARKQQSTTLKLYGSPFPQHVVVNEQLRSATSVAEGIRRLLVYGSCL